MRQKDSRQKLHHKNHNYDAPPPDTTPPIIHKARLLHREIYSISHKLNKRDKLGIHKNIEEVSLELFSLLIEAAFTSVTAKLKPLETARVKASLLQNLIRTENELGIMDERSYLRVSESLVSISKDVNGWIIDTVKRSQTQKRL